MRGKEEKIDRKLKKETEECTERPRERKREIEGHEDRRNRRKIDWYG